MKHSLTILLLLCAASTQAQLKNYTADKKVKVLSEKTCLKISESPHSLTDSLQGFAAVAGALLSPTIDLVSSVVKTEAKRRALLFKGEYSAAASGSGFYQSSTQVNLPDLTLTREVLIKGEAKTTEAASIVLKAELSPDKLAFRYRVAEVKYAYSIAKTKGAWDYIDVSLELTIKTLALNKSQYELKDLRGTSIQIPMIKVGGSYTLNASQPIYSGWIPFPPRPTVEMEVDKIEKEKKTVVVENTKNGEPLPKETNKSETTTSKRAKELIAVEGRSGVYEIGLRVLETNPYKIKAENKQKLVEDAGGKAADLLKAVGELLEKKTES